MSKAGQFRQAVDIYVDLARAGTLDRGSHLSYGWDMAKAMGEMIGRGNEEEILPSVIAVARRYLFAYLNLEIERPSLLHSRMLQLAVRLGGANHLKMVPFLRLWGLENFRPDDFERYEPEAGKSFPALVEKAAQQAGKEAAHEGRLEDIEYILPFLEQASARYSDNVWLKHLRVKSLRGLGRLDDARSLAIEFVKSKTSEYWAWELLGDLQPDAPLRIACYCKALLCSDDDAFVSGLRIKLAQHLVEAGHHAEAKGEISRVLRHKREAGHRVSSELSAMEASDWFSQTTLIDPNRELYTRHAASAEDILFSNLPWTEACVGEKFVIEREEGKKVRRKLFVAGSPFVTEFSVSEARWSLKGMPVGAPVRLKVEFDPVIPGKLMLHAAERRDKGMPFDIFGETIAVVDHVNLAKGVFHWIAGRDVQGTFQLTQYPEPVEIGDRVALKLAAYHSKQGRGFRIVSAVPSDGFPAPGVLKTFKDTVRVSNGMGFTDGGIFIPPDLVAKSEVDDGVVSGLAILNFNKKRSEWGWKAILVDRDSA